MAGGAVLALLLAAAPAADDTATLIARIEALEAKNAELEARLDRLSRPSSISEPAGRDVPAVAPPVAAVRENAAQQRWDRGYVGLQGGFRRGIDAPDLSTDFADYSASGRDSGFVGVQVGHLWQHNSLVAGAELSATIPFADRTRQRFDVRPPFTGEDLLVTFRRTYSFAVKGQIGWASGDHMAYAATGIQVSRYKEADTPSSGGDVITDSPSLFREDQIIVSPFLGAGLASQLTPDFAWEVEGRYGLENPGPFKKSLDLILKVNFLIP